MTSPFFTIGHSNRSLEELTQLLLDAGIALVADIRKIPRSRANPQFNTDTLPRGLAPFGIAYEHIALLGGLRGRSPGVPAEVNGFWMNDSFHRYADYALSAEFHTGLERLLTVGREHRCAMMCSEALWWRCHRRIVTDHLLARGATVFHILGKGHTEPARLTAGARVRPDGVVVYPAASVPSA